LPTTSARQTLINFPPCHPLSLVANRTETVDGSSSELAIPDELLLSHLEPNLSDTSTFEDQGIAGLLSRLDGAEELAENLENKVDEVLAKLDGILGEMDAMSEESSQSKTMPSDSDPDTATSSTSEQDQQTW